MPTIPARKPPLGAIFFALIPFLAMCFTVPLWDRVHPMVLGMPFNLFWLILWILLTPLCLSGAYRIERANKPGKSRKPAQTPRESA